MPKHGKTTKTSKTKKGRARPGSYRGVQDAGDAYLAPRTDEYDGGVDDFFAGRARKSNIQLLPPDLSKTLAKAGKKLKGAFRWRDNPGPSGKTTRLEDSIDDWYDATDNLDRAQREHGTGSGRHKAARWAAASAANRANTTYERESKGLSSGRARKTTLHGHARGKTCPKCRK